MKASLSLFGICVLPWIFRRAGNEGKNKFLIKNVFHQINPITSVLSEPVAPLLDVEFASKFDMCVHSTKADVQKSVFSELEKKKGEYFLIDLSSFDFPILQVEHKDQKYYLSYMSRVNQTSPNVLEALESMGAACKILSPNDYLELFKKGIDMFCDKLLDLYPPEKIILVRTYPTNLCIHSDLSLGKLAPTDPDRFFIDEAIRIFTERVNGCHIIDTLKYMLSFYNVFGGIKPHHYNLDYYDYCFECIDIITDSLPADQEAEKLSELREYYSAKADEAYFTGVEKLIGKNDIRSRKYSYEEFYSRKTEAVEGNTWLEKIRAVYDIKETISPLYADGKELHQITELNEYIKFVADSSKGYVLFFAVGDNAGTNWERFTSKSLISLTQQIKRGKSYIASVDIDSQNTVELYNETSEELKYQCSIILKDQNILTGHETRSSQPALQYLVNISSKGWELLKKDGIYLCWAKIMINNVEYSMNKRGLNAVVFSKIDHCVVDCFYVDMFGDENLTIIRQ